jgi:hypothetical protein
VKDDISQRWKSRLPAHSPSGKSLSIQSFQYQGPTPILCALAVSEVVTHCSSPPATLPCPPKGIQISPGSLVKEESDPGMQSPLQPTSRLLTCTPPGGQSHSWEPGELLTLCRTVLDPGKETLCLSSPCLSQAAIIYSPIISLLSISPSRAETCPLGSLLCP